MQRITMDQVAPELRSRVRTIPSPLFSNPLGRRLFRWLNAHLPSTRVDGVRIEVLPEEANRGLRIYHPQSRRSSGALLWIHGGGYIVGHPAQNDALCASTASELGIVIVAPHYRLAPEHPFPAGLDDCHAGWLWMLAAAARLGIDPANIVIGGESAGGGLAAALVQRIHDEAGPKPTGQWLLCPMLDDRTAANRTLDAGRHFLWDNRSNRFGWRSYLGGDPGSATVRPYSVPARRADLGGLPPAWIGVSDLDLFHDEDRLYAERLRAADVPSQFYEVSGAPHAFYNLAPQAPLALGFMAQAWGWLRERLAAASPDTP